MGGQSQAGGEGFINLDDEVPPATPTDKGNQSDATSGPKRPRRFSKAATTGDDDELTPLLKETVCSLRELVGESAAHKSQRAVMWTELGKIEGITKRQAVRVINKSVKDPDLMDFFPIGIG